MELANAKTSRLRLADVATRDEADADKARTDWQNAQVRLVETQQEAKMARGGLAKIREQAAKLYKAAEKTFRQLTDKSP